MTLGLDISVKMLNRNFIDRESTSSGKDMGIVPSSYAKHFG